MMTAAIMALMRGDGIGLRFTKRNFLNSWWYRAANQDEVEGRLNLRYLNGVKSAIEAIPGNEDGTSDPGKYPRPYLRHTGLTRLSRQGQSLIQNRPVADVIGQHKHQPGFQRLAFLRS
jgi:hypothetical protein